MDKEYEDMMKAEKRAKQNKKKFKYRFQRIKCCDTCKHSSCRGQEEPLECELINPAIDKWSVETIMPLCICNNYDEKNRATD